MFKFCNSVQVSAAVWNRCKFFWDMKCVTENLVSHVPRQHSGLIFLDILTPLDQITMLSQNIWKQILNGTMSYPRITDTSDSITFERIIFL